MKLLLSGKSLQRFCDIVGNFKYVSDSVTFNCSDDGIYSQGMTADHCSLYDFTISSEWFDDYSWDEDDESLFTVSTEMLSKILGTRQPSQCMFIEYYGKPDSITIRFTSGTTQTTAKEFPKEFLLPIIDIENEQLTIPDEEYSAEFGIGSKSLQMTNDQLSLFDETLTIHCSEDEIYLRSKGNEGQLKVTLFDENCEHITEFAIDEDLSLTLDFSIKHFNTFCRFLKVSENIELKFKKDYPMKFQYVMDEPEGEPLLKLVFYLAPKITDDDDDDDEDDGGDGGDDDC